MECIEYFERIIFNIFICERGIYMLAVVISFIVNYIIISFVLAMLLQILPFEYSWARTILSALHIRPDLSNITHLVTIIILAGSTLLYSLRPLQNILIKFMGVRAPQGQEIEYIDVLSKAISQYANVNRDDYQWHVIDDPTWNAFAFGKNHITLNTGLIADFEPNEILGILAHEMGHLQNKDTSYGMLIYAMSIASEYVIRIYSYVVRFLAMFQRIPVLGLLFTMLVWVFNIQMFIIRYMLNAPLEWALLYSKRTQEYAADRYACEIGLGEHLHSALSKLRSSEGGHNPSILEIIYSTHPKTENRLAEISKHIN